MKLYLGEYRVIAVEPAYLSLDLGREVHIHIPTKLFSHGVKAGDTLPLFTEIEDAHPRQPPIQ